MPTALLATAVTCAALLAAVLPHARHRIQQYQDEHTRRTAAEHRRRQLGDATDWAITTAVRECWSRQVDDWRAPGSCSSAWPTSSGGPRTTSTCTSAARKRTPCSFMDRLTFRGHLQTTLVTDDHDQQEGTT
ncbi:hypothetical protein ACH40E_38165 [Streptomyces acidicola]|uniref:hypothetical protein n=1 Tax=Streptomyces acidicola TaxID=2596892 RepID=UPI00378C036F